MRRLVALLVVIAAVLTLTAPAAYADHHQTIVDLLFLPLTLPFKILGHLAPRVVVAPPPVVQPYPSAVVAPRADVYARPAYAGPAYAPAYPRPPYGPSPYGPPPAGSSGYGASPYGPPPAGSSGYGPPPAASAQVQAMAYRSGPTPAAEPARTVRYAHGRYELRGDGVSQTYQWEWIPNAAEPPPAPAPPPAPTH